MHKLATSSQLWEDNTRRRPSNRITPSRNVRPQARNVEVSLLERLRLFIDMVDTGAFAPGAAVHARASSPVTAYRMRETRLI